jgi:hypothetical protein
MGRNSNGRAGSMLSATRAGMGPPIISPVCPRAERRPNYCNSIDCGIRHRRPPPIDRAPAHKSRWRSKAFQGVVPGETGVALCASAEVAAAIANAAYKRNFGCLCMLNSPLVVCPQGSRPVGPIVSQRTPNGRCGMCGPPDYSGLMLSAGLPCPASRFSSDVSFPKSAGVAWYGRRKAHGTNGVGGGRRRSEVRACGLVHRFQSSNHIRRLDRVCKTTCGRPGPG